MLTKSNTLKSNSSTTNTYEFTPSQSKPKPSLSIIDNKNSVSASNLIVVDKNGSSKKKLASMETMRSNRASEIQNRKIPTLRNSSTKINTSKLPMRDEDDERPKLQSILKNKVNFKGRKRTSKTSNETTRKLKFIDEDKGKQLVETVQVKSYRDYNIYNQSAWDEEEEEDTVDGKANCKCACVIY